MYRFQAAWLFGSVFALIAVIVGVSNSRQSVAADLQDVRIVNSKTPFLERVDLSVGKGSSNSFSTQDVQKIFEVPAGKRLVIEHASAEANRSNQIDLSIYLGDTSDGMNRRIYLSYSPQIPFAHKIIFSQPVRLYANPGSKVEVIGEFNVGPEKIVMRPVFCRVTLSGYLEDIP